MVAGPKRLKVPYFYINRIISPIDSPYQFDHDMHDATIVPTANICLTRVSYGIVRVVIS